MNYHVLFSFHLYAALKKTKSKKVLNWIIIILAIYVAGGAGVYFLQEKILFHPVILPADYHYKFNIPFREIDLVVTKEKKLSIVEFTVPDSLRRGVVLYFHGNMRNINRYAHFAGDFIEHGYEVWMMDYPGFGKSTGPRTERIICDDALRLYTMARARFATDSIIIYGKSIGTGVAAQLAAEVNCKRLIMETPFYSIEALAKHYFFIYPVPLMAKYKFPIYQYFGKIKAPITIFHGSNDEIIPYTQAKRLAELNKTNVELITLAKGKHNNLAEFPLFHQKLDSLLRE